MIVVCLPRAVEQLLLIIDHVGEDSPAAAVELGQRIREKTGTLATWPNRYRAGRVRGIREMVAPCCDVPCRRRPGTDSSRAPCAAAPLT